MQRLWHQFQEGGWMMYPILLIGFIAVGTAVLFALRGEQRLLAFSRWMLAALMLAGASGFTGGMMKTLTAAERQGAPMEAARLVMIGTMILAPLAAMIIQMAISRTREYDADRMGAMICGQPMWLASALAKIAGGVAHVPNPDAERHPATAPMFIINPLSGHGMDNLFSTHPATENRIAALRALAGEMGAQPLHAFGSEPRGGTGPWARSQRGPWG